MWTSESGLYISGGGPEAPVEGLPLDDDGVGRAVVGDDSAIALAWTGGFAHRRDGQHARGSSRGEERSSRRRAAEDARERRHTERQFDESRDRFSRVDVQYRACGQCRLIIAYDFDDVTAGIDADEGEDPQRIGHLSVDDASEPDVSKTDRLIGELSVGRAERVALDRSEGFGPHGRQHPRTGTHRDGPV